MKQSLFKVVLCVLFLGFFSVAAFSQIKVTGKIVDDKGETMPGVNVVIKGTSTGTVSDLDGNYAISVPNAESVLNYSFVGYESWDIPTFVTYK